MLIIEAVALPSCLLASGGPNPIINHSLNKLADMVPCTVRAIDSLGKTAPD
jgi:hypothetical protein